MLGTVTKYFKRPRNSPLPYGFILGNDGEEYYFNTKGLAGDIKVGDNVNFFIKGRRNGQGYYATEIQACNT